MRGGTPLPKPNWRCSATEVQQSLHFFCSYNATMLHIPAWGVGRHAATSPLHEVASACCCVQMDEYVSKVMGGMDHDGQIAYDLLPIDEAIGYCHGELCRKVGYG